MRRTAIDYRELLKGLFPRGRAWDKDPGSVLEDLSYAIAEESARLDTRAHDLLDEQEPSIAEELLSEYEEDFGITPESSVVSIRQNALYERQLARGGQWKSYFEDLALALGYIITIEEYTPFWAGVGTGASPCGDQTNIFWWKIQVHTAQNLGGFSCGFDTGFEAPRSLTDIDPYINMVRSFEDLKIEALRLKPGHTSLLFGWYGVSFDAGFDFGFESVPADDETSSYPGFDSGFSIGFHSTQIYDGVYLTGGFSRGFNLGFDSYHGGGFTKGFDAGFEKPS